VATSGLHPEQSFSHTLGEIAINRDDPCELVRELVSNAHDAAATRIDVVPLPDRRGLLVFDNGHGLSQHESARRNGVLPFVAFFSIGRGTKTRGEGIGYKCQGAKLCFASSRFTVLTRCAGETSWRWKSIENPKTTLDTAFDLTPAFSDAPWKTLAEEVLKSPDDRTRAVLQVYGQDFFAGEFTHGTMIVIEGIEVDDYNTWFSTRADRANNYLWNYLQFRTAHGDVRRISKPQGFRPTDINAVTTTAQRNGMREIHLRMWLTNGDGKGKLELVPFGWPYLEAPVGEQTVHAPHDVRQMRSARFAARYATTFSYEDRYYTLILAIDGERRALEGYPMLGRQGAARSGIPLADQRGVYLCSNGIEVCAFDKLFDKPQLKSWSILKNGRSHFVMFIDGKFDLVTNRNAPAPSATSVLGAPGFLDKVTKFLDDSAQGKDGEVLKQLVERLRRETTRKVEDQYQENQNRLRDELQRREHFVVKSSPALAGRKFYVPEPGEEHFVGALNTLFAHLVPGDSPMKKHWLRPLTFVALGIDALAMKDDAAGATPQNLVALEYKYFFAADDEFNHPLNMTSRIVCWDFDAPVPGTRVRDSYAYSGLVGAPIPDGEGGTLGFVVGDIAHESENRQIDHEVTVVSLKRLIKKTFETAWYPATPSAVMGKKKGKK
jgi:hypothetical protein